MARHTGRTMGSLIAGLAAVGVVIGITPQPAWAAVTVKAKAAVSIQTAFASCTEHIFIYTEADFSPPARFDEVRVSFTGPAAPLGKSDSHALSGAASDDFTFQFPTAGLVPGSVLTVKIDWTAHAGNALGAGYDTLTTRVAIHPATVIHKLQLERKCLEEGQAKEYAKNAAMARASANEVRSTCPTCASVLESVAAANESLADKLHQLALDPPDPNFTTLPTATAPSAPPVVAGTGVSAQAAVALNDLLHLLADSIGQARAAVTAIERAQGAHLASDSTWESRQSLAAADFLKGLASKLSGLPTAMQTAGTRLQAGGFPNPTITDAKRAAAVGQYISPGPTNADWLRQQVGLTDADLRDIAALMGAATELISGPQPLLNIFSDPDLAQRVTTLVNALNAEAATLIANPLVNHSGETFTPPTSAPPSSQPAATRSPTAAEGASLLANSGFETPALAAGAAYQTLTTGKEPGLGAWTIHKGSVDVVAAPGAQAATGGQFIDLNGNDSAAGPGIITQDAAVTPGHQYRLSFQLAGNPNGDPPIKTVQVNLGAQQETFTFDTKGHTNDDLGWATHTMAFSACGGESKVTVTFTSTTEGIRGPNLDNVVLADIGPTSCSGGFPIWWVVLGILLLLAAATVVVLYLRRRRGKPAGEAAAQTAQA